MMGGNKTKEKLAGGSAARFVWGGAKMDGGIQDSQGHIYPALVGHATLSIPPLFLGVAGGRWRAGH
jgi:hypothetical protein